MQVRSRLPVHPTAKGTPIEPSDYGQFCARSGLRIAG